MPKDDWSAARDRFNSMVLIKLRDSRSRALVAVATYHMPCAYYSPPQMTIHAGLVAQKAIALAQATPTARAHSQRVCALAIADNPPRRRSC
jgi:hypothetical protein